MTDPRTTLYAVGGFVNPIHAQLREQGLNPHVGGPQFYDHRTRRFYTKQGPGFDAGWRWYDSNLSEHMIIYNKMFNPQAQAEIAEEELVNQGHPLDPEFTLECAQARCTVEHNYFTSKQWLYHTIEGMFNNARRQLFDDIRNNRI